MAGVLSPSGPPGWIVEAVLAGDLEPVFSAAIRAEYEEVLRRPAFKLSPRRVNTLLEAFDAFGLEVTAGPWAYELPDPDDAPFLEAAAASGCPVVTGNLRHFPAASRGEVEVLTPREFADVYGERKR